MKHALLVGVPERAIDGTLDRVPGVDAMATLLDDLGGWSTTVCTGEEATRSRVLLALDAMVSTCRAEDTCLFYFFGHGGVVRFSGVRGELGQRAVFYLATLRPAGSSQRVGVLDIELSDALARLDRTCGNVTTIIDCCHAASMVRDGSIPTVSAPPWLETLAQEPGRDLRQAVRDHPGVVRLMGSSSLRSGYATQLSEGRYGLMTQSVVELIREAGLRCDRLTWDTVAHRAREWTSRQRGTEEQRVVLAGPRHRLLFSRETIASPHSAAFVPGPTPGRGWIRAGILQGVEAGDQWGIAEFELDAKLDPRIQTGARVQRVGLDSAEVVLDDPSLMPPLGATAIMQKLEHPLPVLVEDVPMVEESLRRSGLVRPATSEDSRPIARVLRTAASPPKANTVDVLDERGRPLWLGAPLADADAGRLVELIEDRARARRLQDSLCAASSYASTDSDLIWDWGTFGTEQELCPLPMRAADEGDRPRVHAGERVWLRLRHRGSTPRRWFASVLLVDIEGRLGLLNAHEPEGIEVAPGISTFVGLRGSRRQQGLTCYWPSGVHETRPRPERLIILASRRPFSIGHLVRVPEPHDPAAFAPQGLGMTSVDIVRGEGHRPFVASSEWTWGEIAFELAPSEGYE